MNENALKTPKTILAAVDFGQTDFKESFEELKELAATAECAVLGSVIQKRESVDKASVFGKGKISELKLLIEDVGADTVVFDNELTPAQAKNLEDLLGCVVIDRTGLILDIFARHAKTKVGKLQVEAARLKYLLPRLTGKHRELSRLAGGIGTRGPGESQLEADRRHLRARIARLQHELSELEKGRSRVFDRRKKERRKVVAIVGYTNSGKSTLLNALTDATVLAEDKLFATLDPTARKIKLPCGQDVLLVDTVGFIRNLPHEIVNAFKSTLNEAVEADLLLYVEDYSAQDMGRRREIVDGILSEIGANAPVISIYNKIDLTDLPEGLTKRDCVFVSAKHKIGLTDLIDRISHTLTQDWISATVQIPFTSASILAEIYKRAEVIDCFEGESAFKLRLRFDPCCGFEKFAKEKLENISDIVYDN